jgi:hypothetical protein
MNNGVLIGYTRKFSNIQPGDTYPQLNVRYNDRTAFTLTQDDVNFVICTTSATAVTITLPRMSLRSGECIHIKQDGAGQVTISPTSEVTIDVASTVKKTRAQNSVVTLMKEDDARQSTQVWLLFGDFASS